MSSTPWSLTGTWHLHPTPAGAFFAVSSPEEDPARSFLRGLLREQVTPAATAEEIAWRANIPVEEALGFLYRLQESGLIQGVSSPLLAPQDSLEVILPNLLPQLSDVGKVLLAESQGLAIANTGFTHEVVEELAVLAVELAGLRTRHHRLVHNNLRIRATGWGLVDANGHGELGFWPMHVGRELFILVVSGQVRFNQAAYTTLAWTLSSRYDTAR